MQRMETSFSNALEKITTQQANLFETKLKAIDEMYSKSLDSQNEKFSMLMNKFEEMTTKNVTASKEAEHYKTELKNAKYVNTLEQESIRSKYDLQISQLKQQNEKKTDTLTNLDSEVSKLSARLSEQQDKIQSLEDSHVSPNKQLEKKMRKF